MIELQLKDGIQNLSQQRDSLVMELQQLQEAKPVLEKAYAVRPLINNVPEIILLLIKFRFIAFVTPKFEATNTAVGNEKSALATVHKTTTAVYGNNNES